MSRKMKEKLSRAFETYDVCKLNNVEHMQAVEEPVIQLAKAQFQKSYRNKNKFRDLLLCQLKFCGIKMWTFELLIAIITSLILRNLLADPYFMTTRKLVFFVVCFAIAVPMMLLPFLYRSIRYQMFEMESVSVFSIKTVLFSKFLLFFGGEVLLVASVLLVLWNTTSITFAELAGCILIVNFSIHTTVKIKSEKLCQSFLGFGIVLIAIIVISFRLTEQMLWMRMTPATVVSILGLVLYGVYQSMTLFKKYE